METLSVAVKVWRLRSLWARVRDAWLGPRAVPHAHYVRVGLIVRAKLETHNALARVVELLRSVPRVVPHAHYARVGLNARARKH